MTSPTPAPGWYPDPAARRRERYWDGVAWAPETRAAVPPPPPPFEAARPPQPVPVPAPAPRPAPAPVVRRVPAPVAAGQPGTGGATAVAAEARRAGVLARVGATFLDALLLLVLNPAVWLIVGRVFAQAWSYAQRMQADPGYRPDYSVSPVGPEHFLLAIGVAAVLSVVYDTILLARFGSTLGQLATGVRVVRRDHDDDRRLPLSVALLRAVGWAVSSAAGSLFLASSYGLLPFALHMINCTRPMGGQRTLVDLIAGTDVVARGHVAPRG